MCSFTVYLICLFVRLGLFVTGCSPGGGASNIWTVMFGGNLNLSVTMTALSTFAAFVMMPAWIFSLGQHLIMGPELEDQYDIVIPYYKIAIYCFFLVIPLSIGLAVARCLPKVVKRNLQARVNQAFFWDACLEVIGG